jgi:fructokinase
VHEADIPHVVVIGDALIDELRDTDGVREFPGGAGLNVAVGLAILGMRTGLVAMVGGDEDGTRIRRHLKLHGVALYESLCPNGSARAVSERTSGEPVYSFNASARGRRIDFDQRQRAALDGADLVVVSSYPFDDADQVAELGAAVENSGERLLIDPNPRTGLLKDPSEFRRGFEDLARRALLVKVGDEDAALLYGSDPGTVGSRLLRIGARAVLATGGCKGASLVTSTGISVSEDIVDLPGAIIDTMGAGDATLASVASAVARTGLPETAGHAATVLRRAMGVAAATCRHEGALLRAPERRPPSTILPPAPRFACSSTDR